MTKKIILGIIWILFDGKVFDMLETYFFMPANRIDFLKKINKIKSDHFIIDLEDTIQKSQINDILSYLPEILNVSDHYFRPNLNSYHNFDDLTSHLLKLSEVGVKKVILPKTISCKFLKNILKLNLFEDQIILIETPDIYLKLKKILKRFHTNIKGIAIGTQDLSLLLELKNENSIFNQIRFELNLLAKKYQIKFIDTASMKITDIEGFKEECLNAFSFGCNGKMIIHPKQLDEINKLQYYSEEEIQWAIKANLIIAGKTFDEITAYNVEGQIFEKPHVKKIEKIIKSLK